MHQTSQLFDSKGLREDEGDSSVDALLEPRTHESSLLGSWASTLDRMRFQSHEPQSRSLCGRRVCRAARMRCDLPSPCVHAPTPMSEWGGPRAGALAHKYQGRTW